MAGHSQASEDLRVLNGQRQGPPPQTEHYLVCNMSGHRAIAQAALQASAEEPDASAQADVGMQQALQSLMQDMKVLGLAKRPPSSYCASVHIPRTRVYAGTFAVALWCVHAYEVAKRCSRQPFHVNINRTHLIRTCASRCRCPCGRSTGSWVVQQQLLLHHHKMSSKCTGGAWAVRWRAHQ